MNRGINFYVDGNDNPHKLTLPVLNPVAALQYRMKDGTSGPLTDTVVNPDIWDDPATPLAYPGSTVPTNKFTVQRIFKFTSNNVKLQPGQAIYNSMAEAKASIQTEAFVTEPSIEANGFLRGYLCIQEGTTDLSNPAQAFFLDPGKFGGGFGTGGLSVSTLQNAYDNSSNPEILTDSTRGALSIKRGSAADVDNIIEVIDGNDQTTAYIRGDGTIEGSNVGAGGNVTAGGNVSGGNLIGTGNQSTVNGKHIVNRLVKTITLQDPTSADVIPIWHTDKAITIDSYTFEIIGSTDCSFNLEYVSTLGGAATVIASETANTTTQTSLFVAPAYQVAANNYLQLNVTGITGTPDYISVNIYYTMDANS
jgi:hypothetical protein